MILAATDWLTVSINLLLILFVIICIVMTLMILMQRPKQEGLGAAFGGGMTDQMFGARTTNVLQRGTVWFASLFFVLALTLAVLIGMKNSRTPSLAESTEAEQEAVAGAEESTPSEDEFMETIRTLIEESPPTDEIADEEAPVEETTPDEIVEDTPEPEENSEQP